MRRLIPLLALLALALPALLRAQTTYSSIASSSSGWQKPPCSNLNPVASDCAGGSGNPQSNSTFSTTITQAITSTGSQTVTVGSTTGMAVGQAPLVGTTSAGESITITAVGTGTITATFSQTHTTGVALTCCYTTQTFGNASPVIDTGSAMLIGFTGQSGLGTGQTTNVLWPWKGAYATGLQSFLGTYNIEFPVVSNVQAAEYDQFYFSGGYRAMMGSQCESPSLASGKWDVWNSQAGSWVSTGVDCTILTTPNVVHHITWQTYIDPSTGTACSGHPCMHYVSLTVDGTPRTLNLTEPYSTSSDANAVGIQPQLDCSGGSACSEYIDADMSLVVSPGNTYYIAASGSDSNSGTSKTAPWLHAPGMANCAANCAGYSGSAGDNIVLRGGDTWMSASFPWRWSWSGSTSSSITVGVDQTWYSGSSWTRPVLTGGGTYPGGSASFFLAISGSNVAIANLEFTGLYWSGSAANGELGYISKGTQTNVMIHDNYFHGWSHAPGVVVPPSGFENNNVNAITCISGGYQDTTSSVYNNVIDGSDTSMDSFGGVYGYQCPNVYRNYFAWLDNGLNGSWLMVHDNVFSNTGVNVYAGGNSHNNVAESNTDDIGAVWYNNVFIHMNPGASGGIGIQLAPQAGQTTYFFNNVLADGSNFGNILMCGASLSNSGGSCEFFNNTEECGPDSSGPTQSCIRMGSGSGSPPSGAQIINNHMISSGSVFYLDDTCSSCVVTLNPSPQTQQTIAAANGQGYTLTETYAFSPTSPTNITVGAGVNENGLCGTISAVNNEASQACLSDTSYGVSYNTSNHTVSWPARTPVIRPASGPWDAGAYEFATPLETLAVTVTAGGSVSSSPSGILCPTLCTNTFVAGTVVVLTATPNSGYSFMGWSGGGCLGTAPCALLLNVNEAVTATFAPTAPTNLFVTGGVRVTGAIQIK